MIRSSLAIVAVLALCGCGEKITLPDAMGIPTSSRYIEQDAWELTDPVDVLEADGRIFLAEASNGRVAKYRTSGDVQFEQTGLGTPSALGLQRSNRLILVGESDGPAISIWSQNDLAPVGRVELAGLVLSISALVSDDSYVYVSDPDSAAVHRFAWTTEAEGFLVAQGLVADSRGSRESPQFVFDPQGLVFDSEGRLLICDADTDRNWILRFDPAPPEGDPNGRGTAVPFFETSCPVEPPASFVLGSAPACGETFEAGPSTEPAGLHAPAGVTIDADGRIYVADRNNGRTQRWEPTGDFESAFADGSGETDPLEEPVRLCTWLGRTVQSGLPIVIPGARVYVVDRARNQLRMFEDRRWSEFQNLP